MRAHGLVCVSMALALVVGCGDGSSGKSDAGSPVLPDGSTGATDGPPVTLDTADAAVPSPDLPIISPDVQPDIPFTPPVDTALADLPGQDGGSNERGIVLPVVDAHAVDGASLDAGGGETGPVATVVDPAPGFATPGRFTTPTTCTACPSSSDSTFTVDAGTATSQSLSGQVTGAVGNGTFYVESAPDANGNREQISGAIPTDASGNYAVTVPLFCGVQTLKLVWTNAAGTLVIVKQVTTSGCTQADIRATITWDSAGDDWELHLIKPGGRINDQTNLTDCTWTTCIGTQPDWGVVGDSTDNPSKDVDDTDTYGPENIYLSKPETGRYTVMVEHWGPGSPSTGQAILNVRGMTYLFTISNFVTKTVWTVATIDWPAGTVTAVDTRYDCSASWSSGCVAALP
jgi:uncharacterized protein YfaP (DUF2135 family)